MTAPPVRFLLCLMCALLVTRSGFAADTTSAGPLFDQFPLTIAEGWRTEMLGPFWSTERQGTESTRTLAPFFSWQSRPDVESVELDVLYPLATYHRYGAEHRLQFFELFSTSGGQSQSGATSKRVTLFPIYFQQRSSDPEENYTGLIPFYGRVKKHFFRDEAKWILFPAYMQTRKQDVVTDNYLVPFVHTRHGQGLTGWQVWPLGGHEHKDVTSVTNGFGDVETVGGHDKTFVLWPIYFHDNLGVGTTNPVTQRLLLPFYSQQRSPARDSTSYLWPLGVTVTDDREKQYHEVDAPWPFIVFAHGEGKTANRVWPLFGHARTREQSSDFYLWPLYKYGRIHSDPLDRARVRILFFLYSDLVEKNTETGKSFHRTDLWPLFTARREQDGSERFQFLSLFEPFVPGNEAVERSYGPLWSLWRSEKNARTGATSQSLLWNLYRRQTATGLKKCSLLFGLIQYEKRPDGTRWRWLFIPSGKRTPAQAPTSTPGPAP